MGWFDEQIKERIRNDEDGFSESFINMSSVIIGRTAATNAIDEDSKISKDAITEILKYYHIKPQEAPENLKDLNEQLEYQMRPSGIMRRSVLLTGAWYKDGIGALLGSKKDGTVVAIMPQGLSGYTYFDAKEHKRIRVTKKTAELLSEEATCFYKPLPLKSLGIPHLLKYILQILSIPDFIMVIAATVTVTLIGMLMPKINNIIYSVVIPGGNASFIPALLGLLIGITFSQMLIGITKSLIMTRIQTKMDIAVQSASMMRVMSLPVKFFKTYSSGEMSSRVQSINSLCSTLANLLLSTGLTSVFSLVYVTQIFKYAPALAIPALILTGVTIVFSIVSTFAQMNLSKKMMRLGAKQSGLIYALISGVQKIKMSGSEKRAFSKWANSYAQIAKLQYDPPIMLKINSVISMAIGLIGTLIMYYSAAASSVSVADYMSFNVAYGMVSGSFMSLASIVLTVANIRPIMDMVEPILKTVPEISVNKKVITKLSGAIELNNVSFRYLDTMPIVIDDLSLKIRAGQYVAIVGTTGCGKSTLMRLMIGFETPQKGAVYFDGKDLSTIDLKSLRRNIGVVMQNGKLFSGDIYSNITISAPWLTVDDAWKAAELAGIADDIRDMPMGMNTIISEGSGGVSGGQRQRLMIARAIAPKPKILIFDEATSALDNITQKTVSNSLSKLKCTRVVIAHRLSTIKDCDRIIVIDKGKITEDGTYKELLDKGGYFSELVERQRLDN